MAAKHHRQVNKEQAVAEISVKDFLDFLKISYQVNEAIEKVGPEDENFAVDWKKLTANELINRLRERDLSSHLSNSVEKNEETAVSIQARNEIEKPDGICNGQNKKDEGSRVKEPFEKIGGIRGRSEEKSLNENGKEKGDVPRRQSSARSLDKKCVSGKGKRSGSCRRKSSGSKGEGSGESETSASFDGVEDRTPAKALKKKLSEVLQEGILDSILPYLMPKQQSPQEYVQSSTKKHNELKRTGVGNTDKMTSFSSREKTEQRRKCIAGSDVDADKKDREVIIHVCDEIKNLKKDFRCSQKLLVSQMGYFAEVTNGQKLEDMDISVHCDVTIFDWLMKWVQKDGSPQKHIPVLDPSIVIPVLMSSAFLQMDSLQDYCLQYCKIHINDIIRDSPNLSCLNDNVLTRLANLFSNAEIEGIIDRKDKIQSKLFCKLISSLCEPEPQPRRGHFSSIATMYRCSKCLKLILKNMSGSVSCFPSNMLMDQNGLTQSVHLYDSKWSLTEYVRELKSEMKTWRKVYWRLWSDCHLLFCSACEEYFPVHQMSWCRYHIEPVQYFHVEKQKTISHPLGRYPCCGEREYRFEVVKKNSGCHYRDHTFNCKTTVDEEIVRIWNLFKHVIHCDPPPIVSMAKHGKPAFVDVKNSYRERFWWDGLKLVPGKHSPCLLAKMWETVTRKEENRFGVCKNNTAASSNGRTQKSPVTKSSTHTPANLQDVSSFSDSSDESCSSFNEDNSEESYHSTTKLRSKTKTSESSSPYLASTRLSFIRGDREKKRRKKKNLTIKSEENRFWVSKLSTRSNQDNQRDFEERAFKQIELILAKKLCGESFRAAGSRCSYQSIPPGGIYVKLEQEWREAHCYSHGCPGSSLKARGSASYVNVNNSSFTLQKRSKSRGQR